MFVDVVMSWLLSVLNLANSIIGVSVLSMPFILSKCGIVLGLFLVLACGYLTAQSCWMLLQSGHIMHKSSYELLGLALFGKLGKFLMEISNIGLLFGIVVAMFIIIGDLAPECIQVLFKLEMESSRLRTYILILMCLGVVLPLSLLRDVKKLSVAAGVSMVIYVSLIIYLFILSSSTLTSTKWLSDVSYFDSSGILSSVAILGLAFACQMTLFLIRDSHNDKSVPGMFSVVKATIGIVATFYCLTGLFGYVKFNSLQEIPGDIIMAFPKTTVAFVMRLSFAGTVILSIPLCVFACRTSVDSFIVGFLPTPSKPPVLNALPHIPSHRFVCITVTLVITALLIAIFIPNVELVLQLTGATMGSCVAFIFPAAYYLKASKPNAPKRSTAGFLLMFGTTILVISTCVTIMNSDMHQPIIEEEIPALVLPDTTATTAPSAVETIAVSTEEEHHTRPPSVSTEGGSDAGLKQDSDKDSVDSHEAGVGGEDDEGRDHVSDGTMTSVKAKTKQGSRKEPPVPEDFQEDEVKLDSKPQDVKPDAVAREANDLGIEKQEESSTEDSAGGSDKDTGDEAKIGNKEVGKDGKEVIVLKPEDQKKILKKLDEMQERIEDLEKEQRTVDTDTSKAKSTTSSNDSKAQEGNADQEKQSMEEANAAPLTNAPNSSSSLSPPKDSQEPLKEKPHTSDVPKGGQDVRHTDDVGDSKEGNVKKISSESKDSSEAVSVEKTADKKSDQEQEETARSDMR